MPSASAAGEVRLFYSGTVYALHAEYCRQQLIVFAQQPINWSCGSLRAARCRAIFDGKARRKLIRSQILCYFFSNASLKLFLYFLFSR